ncbi:hypothetical protein SVAN01_06240 [Stagonosporopsis vannaccii]|nr:hypothetical protein SVAN01_06240 [Stagonosporopsis vannaccii]
MFAKRKGRWEDPAANDPTLRGARRCRQAAERSDDGASEHADDDLQLHRLRDTRLCRGERAAPYTPFSPLDNGCCHLPRERAHAFMQAAVIAATDPMP